ncbi:zinc finger CCCH domain-containing protein 6-like protein, partial [Tanacetum coccineum]
FYSAGVCKYGQFCRFSHPLELNVLGLPKRLGKTECSFYMHSGMCHYGTSCRFDHPDPIFALYSEQESSVVKGKSMCDHKEGLELTDAGYVLNSSEETQSNLSVPMITADSFMYMYPNCVLDGYQVCP